MSNDKPTFEVSADRIVAIGRDGIHYVWNCTDDTTDYIARATARYAYEELHKVKTSPLCGVNADYDTDHAWIFYVADCFDPPLYLVFGRSFEDAYQTFITDFERLIKIETKDLADYGDDVTMNENGTPVDDESVQYIAVASIVVTDTAHASKDS